MKGLPLNHLGNVLVEDCSRFDLKMFTEAYQKLKSNLIADLASQAMGVSVNVAETKLHHGSSRLWLVCPSCNKRCATLFQHPDTLKVGCKCLGLTYRKQRYKGMIENQFDSKV